jgi:cyclic-di-GMP-binding protein
MADEFSFDVVSKVDLQFIDDSVNACNREIAVRFDFRGSISKLEWDKAKAEITLHSDNEGKLKSVIEILHTRLAKRGVDLKSLDPQKLESALGGTVRQVIKIKQGIASDKAKAIVADIKSAKIKVTASIQADQVRVTSKSKDALQQTMNLLNGKDYGLPVQFTNFR